MNTTKMIGLVGVAALGSLFASGCATKTHVRNTVAPLERRIGENDKQLASHTKTLEGLELGVSQANERAVGAQGQADQALKDAGKANELATDAGRRAESARGVAEESLTRAAKVDGRLDRTIENLENYKLVKDENVLFAFGKSELSPAAKAQLDEAVKSLGEGKRFVIEVEGFTDRTGSPAYNLELSQSRADAVVRYLTTAHKLPLRTIHKIGYGVEAPAADNKTMQGRKLNRRVEVKLLVADLGAAEPKLDAGNVLPQRQQ